MTAENFTLFVACTHVQVRIKFTIQLGYVAKERDNFVVARKGVGLILLCVRVEHANGEVAHRAYRRNGGKRHALLFADDFELFADFLAPVNAGDYFIKKYSVFHLSFLIIF